MPKRSYPFDYYSQNSQTKFHMPDKDYLTVVYEQTIKRLFAAARNLTSSASTCQPSETAAEDPNASIVKEKQKQEESDLKILAVACNQCLDTIEKNIKGKCEFCEKLNCRSKCLQACVKCSHSFCANCITIK